MTANIPCVSSPLNFCMLGKEVKGHYFDFFIGFSPIKQGATFHAKFQEMPNSFSPGKIDKNIKWLSITKTCLFYYTESFTTKNENFKIKNSDICFICAQNIDCGYSLEPPRRGGSNEYTQSMSLSRNKKTNVYPCKPQFYYIKVGFKGGQNYIGMFL